MNQASVADKCHPNGNRQSSSNNKNGVSDSNSSSGSESSDEEENVLDCKFDEDGDEDENEYMNRQVKGLFCEKTFAGVKELFEHEAEFSGFNLVDVVNRFRMDMISYIKMINYIRKEVLHG